MSQTNFLQQVSLYAPNSVKNANEIDENTYIEELKQFRQDLKESCYVWPEGIPMAGSPLPVLVPKHFNPNLENLGDILCRAITSIIGRWWTDSVARFPERMPLLSQEEAVLRWMDGPGKEFVPSFESQKGVWRPDFLFKSVDEAEESGQVSGEAFVPEPPLQICEINARFAFNAFFICAFSNEVLRKRGLPDRGLASRIDPEEIYGAYENMIDINKPLHLLKGTEHGLDIHLFYEYLRKRRGIAVRFIKPAGLRLIPDSTSGSGFKLYCISENPQYYEYGSQLPVGMIISSANEILEEIHQVALELHQRELKDLGLDMLKTLAPICFNDLRAIYLVHDKRMLGIVLQELDSLVHEHRVIDAEEAEILRRGIVPTILPGSLEMLELLRRSKLGLEAKENYLIKPVGSGKGAGFVFGSDVIQDEWIQSLERLTTQNVAGPLYVVQEVIKQPKFEVFIPQEETRSELLRHYFVGTFMMVNGKYLGIPPWRTSKARICAVSHGGAWISSLESP